jgi:hypothetical protein
MTKPVSQGFPVHLVDGEYTGSHGSPIVSWELIINSKNSTNIHLNPKFTKACILGPGKVGLMKTGAKKSRDTIQLFCSITEKNNLFLPNKKKQNLSHNPANTVHSIVNISQI